MENVRDKRKRVTIKAYGSEMEWIKARHEQMLKHLARECEELQRSHADSPWSLFLGKMRITPRAAHDVAIGKLATFTVNDKDKELLNPLHLFGFAEYFLDFKRKMGEDSDNKGSDWELPTLRYTTKKSAWVSATEIVTEPHIDLVQEANPKSYYEDIEDAFDSHPTDMTDGVLEMARAIGLELIDLFAIVVAPTHQGSRIGDFASGVSYRDNQAFIFNIHNQKQVSLIRDLLRDNADDKDAKNGGSRLLALKMMLKDDQRWLTNTDYVVWAIPTTLSQEPFIVSSFKIKSTAQTTNPLIVRFSTIFGRARKVMIERALKLASGDSVSFTTAQAVVQQGLHEAGYYRSMDDAVTRTIYAVGAWRSSQQLFFRRIIFLMSLGVPRSQCTIHKDYIDRFSMPKNPPSDSDEHVHSGDYQTRFAPLTFWQALKVVLCARKPERALKEMLAEFDTDAAWFAASINHTSAPSNGTNIYADLVSKVALPALHLMLEGTFRFLTARKNTDRRPKDEELSLGLAHQATHLFTWFRDLTPLVLIDMETRISDELKFSTETDPQVPGGGQTAMDIAIPIDGPLETYWKNCVRAGPPYVPVDDHETLDLLKNNPLFPIKLILSASIRENTTRYLRYMDINIDMLGERSWRTGEAKAAIDPFDKADLKRLVSHYSDHHRLMGEARHHKETLLTANSMIPQILDPYDIPNERARILYAYARYVWFKWYRAERTIPTNDGPERLALWQLLLRVEIDPTIPETRELTQIAMLMGDTLFFPLVFDTLYSATPASFNLNKRHTPLPQYEALLYLVGWLEGTTSQQLIDSLKTAVPLFKPYTPPSALNGEQQSSYVPFKETLNKLTSLNLYNDDRQGNMTNQRKVPLATIYNVHKVDHKFRLPYDAHTTLYSKVSPSRVDEWTYYTIVRNGVVAPEQFFGPSSGLNLVVNFPEEEAVGTHAIEIPSFSFPIGEYMRVGKGGEKGTKQRGATNYAVNSSLRQASQHRLGEMAINRYQKIVPIEPEMQKKSGRANKNLLFEWPSSSNPEVMHPLLHCVRLFLGHRYLPSTPVFDASHQRDGTETPILTRDILHSLMRFSLIMGRADTSNAMETLMADAASLLIMWETSDEAILNKLHMGSDSSIALDTFASHRIISAEPVRRGWRVEWSYESDKLLVNSVGELLGLFEFDASTTLEGVNLLQGMTRDINAHVSQVPVMALHTLASVAFARYKITQDDVELTQTDLALRCGWIGVNIPTVPSGENDVITHHPLLLSIPGIDEKLRPRPFVAYDPSPQGLENAALKRQADKSKKRRRSSGGAKRKKKENVDDARNNEEEKTDDIITDSLAKRLSEKEPPKKKRRLSKKEKNVTPPTQPMLIDLVDGEVDGTDFAQALANEFKQAIQEVDKFELAKRKKKKNKPTTNVRNNPPPNVIVMDEDAEDDMPRISPANEDDDNDDGDPMNMDIESNTPRGFQQEPADDDDEEASESSLSLLGDSFGSDQDDDAKSDSDIDAIRSYIMNMRRKF